MGVYFLGLPSVCEILLNVVLSTSLSQYGSPVHLSWLWSYQFVNELLSTKFTHF